MSDFVSDCNPRFICRGVGPGAAENARWVARLAHWLGPPASEAGVEALQSGFGNSVPKEFIEFYSLHDGIRLYIDSIENSAGFATSGIYVASVDDWPMMGAGMQSWLDLLDEDELEELVPSWTEDAIVFGEVPNSGNYFILGMSGEYRGKIYYFDHDGFEFELFANSLSEFIAKIISKPARLLDDLGCHARYSDGESDIQWIPEEYAAGEASL